jgi:hypothetical protein
VADCRLGTRRARCMRKRRRWRKHRRHRRRHRWLRRVRGVRLLSRGASRRRRRLLRLRSRQLHVSRMQRSRQGRRDVHGQRDVAARHHAVRAVRLRRGPVRARPNLSRESGGRALDRVRRRPLRGSAADVRLRRRRVPGRLSGIFGHHAPLQHVHFRRLSVVTATFPSVPSARPEFLTMRALEPAPA